MELINQAMESAMEQFNEQLEKDLIGAWRAGYNYLHIYSEPQTHSLGEHGVESFTMTQYTLPSYTKERPDPERLDYSYTYDLTSVPDEVVMNAIQ